MREWYPENISSGRFNLAANVSSTFISIGLLAGLLVMISMYAQPRFALAILTLVGLLIFGKTVVSFSQGQVQKYQTDRSWPESMRASTDNNRTGTPQSELAQALGRCRLAFVGVGLFSCVVNILMLTAPLFMLQIYDRVLPSHSVPTLIGLAILAAALFAFQGILDATRGRVLLRIGNFLTAELSRAAAEESRWRGRATADAGSRPDPKLSQQHRARGLV